MTPLTNTFVSTTALTQPNCPLLAGVTLAAYFRYCSRNIGIHLVRILAQIPLLNCLHNGFERSAAGLTYNI